MFLLPKPCPQVFHKVKLAVTGVNRKKNAWIFAKTASMIQIGEVQLPCSLYYSYFCSFLTHFISQTCSFHTRVCLAHAFNQKAAL